jgi:hypothetical protein
MKKRSPLQEQLISRIDGFCGVDKLIAKLEKYKQTLPAHERIMFINFIHYYQSLYLFYVPVEKDFVFYRNAVILHLNLLEKHIEVTNCRYLKFLYKNTTYGAAYTKDIRRLV